MDNIDVKNGSLKKRSGWINRINKDIKKYKKGLDSGVLQDLSEDQINYEVFSNIENIGFIINGYLERYLDFNPVGDSKINKEKYENNVDRDYPGLRKLIDTWNYYYETIKYQKTYILPESERGSFIRYDYDSDSERDSDR